MDEITGYLELAALNSAIAEAYLKDAEDELATVAENLEDSLRLVTILRHHSTIAERSSN